MEIKEIAEKIQQAGGKLYLVGGAVRDKLLGRNIQDKDYAITGITENTFLNLFPEAKNRGKSFCVYEIEGKEFAFARREKKAGQGHKNFEIEVGENISIEEDLKRRDLTINAMAIDVLEGTFIDPFQGREDIEKRILRKTSQAFKEDPLRVYRVARFAACLEFAVEEKTLKTMKEMKGELNTLSTQRIWGELKKALEARKPSIFFEILREANVLDVHFKEIQDLIGSIQPEKYHPEGDSYIHTMQVLDICSKLTQDQLEVDKERTLQIRFGSLVHDLGKGNTPKQIRPHHYGHEERGVLLVENLGTRLKIPNDWIKCGKVAAKEHMRGGIYSKMKPSTQVDFLTRIDKSKLGLEGLEIIVKSDKYREEESIKELKEKEIFAKEGKRCIQEVTGQKIKEKYNLPEGKKLGEILRQERIKWHIRNLS